MKHICVRAQGIRNIQQMFSASTSLPFAAMIMIH